MAEEIYGFDESKSKVTLKSGAGITVGEDGTIGHTNEMEASTTYIGGTTAVPMIKIDEAGHVVALTKQTIYPPTSAGEAGQVWTSDGAGAGKWADAPGGGEWVYASAVSEVMTVEKGTYYITTVLKDFQIMYHYTTKFSPWLDISAGRYCGSNISGAKIGMSPVPLDSYIDGETLKVTMGSNSYETPLAYSAISQYSVSGFLIRYKA